MELLERGAFLESHHNPDGLYNGTNPLVRPFNRG